MKNIIQIHIDWTTKVVTLIHPTERILGVQDGIIEITEDMIQVKRKQAIDLFEEDVTYLLTLSQEIILYRSWAMALSVMIGNTALMLEVGKSTIKEIIASGERHGILYPAHNSTWKIKDRTVIKDRWLEKVRELESRIPGSEYNDMPQTPEESIERLEKMSTPEQKAIARGEEGMVSLKEGMIVKHVVKDVVKHVVKDIMKKDIAKESLIDPEAMIAIIPSHDEKYEVSTIKNTKNKKSLLSTKASGSIQPACVVSLSRSKR